jgi:hypothetical protein
LREERNPAEKRLKL